VAGDFWSWIVGVFTRIGDVSIYWLILALALKTAESALIGLGWLIGIFRTRIPGSTVAGVASATIVQSLFFTAVSVLMVIALGIVRPRSVSKGSPSNETGGLFASHPVLVPIVVVVAIAVVVLLWPRLKPRLLTIWHGAKQGAAIFRDWRRYAKEVALPSGASFGCRIGVNIVFMAAFHIPVTAFTVFLVASSHMLSQVFAITPGGVGQTQALDVATLRRYASTDDIAAFSITQDAVITLWNVVLGLAVMLWAFGYGQVKQLLSRSQKHPQEESVV
jgi:hypothetical protein